MPKILLVEDNELNRDMLTRRLVRIGYDIDTAEDGEAALIAAQKMPDVILMDLSLPKIDGWECTRRIRADERIAHIPIIALTAHALGTDRDKALEAGCNDYDTKPVIMERLTEKIEALLAVNNNNSKE